MKHILRIHEAGLEPSDCEWYRLIEVRPLQKYKWDAALTKKDKCRRVVIWVCARTSYFIREKCRNNAECAAFLRVFLFVSSTAARLYRTQTLEERLRFVRK